MASLTLRTLGQHWLEMAPYQPRVATADGDEWFLMAERFRPAYGFDDATVREPACGRDRMRDAFSQTYAEWDLPHTAETQTALSRVGSPGTAVIVTGQQPGFLGGPLYTLYKALSAVALAQAYRQQTGRACVAVFWVAGDDHDLDEVRTVRFPGASGEDVVFSFSAPVDRRPISDYEISTDDLATLEAAAAHLAPRRFGSVARELIEQYRGRNLASGFAAMLHTVLGKHGLLCLDPVHLRPLAAEVVKQVIERPDGVLDAITRGRSEVTASGLKPFVAARLPLFLLENGARHHLSPAEGGLEIDGVGRHLSTGALIERLRTSPRLFSAGALLRPFVQQYTLPAILSVGGPAEVGYFAQLGPLSRLLGIESPPIALRLHATIIDGRLVPIVSRFDDQAIARAKSAAGLVADRDAPDSLAGLDALAATVANALEDAASEVPAGIPSAKRLPGSADKIVRDIRHFKDRALKAWAENQKNELAQARKLWNYVYPSGGLQERRWGFLHFVAKHGVDWIDSLIAAIAQEPFELSHRWLLFDAQKGDARTND